VAAIGRLDAARNQPQLHDMLAASASRRRADPVVVKRLKLWVADALLLGPEATVFVSEVECRDPGCEGVHTTLLIFRDASVTTDKAQRVKIPKAAGDITERDIAVAFGIRPALPHGAGCPCCV
jgi:hypothetical protein